MDGPVRCSGRSADPVRREGVCRPARLPPLAGGTLHHPSSSDTHKAHDEAPGATQESLRVMLQTQVKWAQRAPDAPILAPDALRDCQCSEEIKCAWRSGRNKPSGMTCVDFSQRSEIGAINVSASECDESLHIFAPRRQHRTIGASMGAQRTRALRLTIAQRTLYSARHLRFLGSRHRGCSGEAPTHHFQW